MVLVVPDPARKRAMSNGAAGRAADDDHVGTSSGPDERVDVVLASSDRVTLRVGDRFIKVDADRGRSAREGEAIRLAPVPTPEILWHEPPALALAAVHGRTLGRLGEPTTAPPTAWAAVGAVIRQLHDAPLPPWSGPDLAALTSRLDDECAWLVEQRVLSAAVVDRHRRRARAVLRPWRPVFIHGDLHLEHVFVDGDRVTGIIDWSEAQRGDAAFDIASLTLGNATRLDDVVSGYGGGVDIEIVRAWWSYRCLVVVRWLTENGYGEPDRLPEVHLLRASH